MGKIPEYQRSKFASTFVGAPQLDTSGVQAVKGINQAVAPIVDIAATDMHNKEVARIDQQANNALVHYSLAYQQRVKDMEQEYADNPEGFPTAVAELGQNLQNEYAGAIPDARIRTRFSGAAVGVVKQTSMASLSWVEAKNAENAFLSWDDSLGTAVKAAAGQTSVEGFTSTLGQIASIADSYTEGTPEARVRARETRLDEATRGYMSAQLDADARGFWKDIDQGKYNGLKFEHNGKSYNVPISSKLKEEYKNLAEKKSLTQQAEKQIQEGLRVAGELEDLAMKVNSGEAGLRDLMYKRDRIYGKGVADGSEPSTPEQKANIDALIKLEVSTLAKNGKTDPYTLDDLNSKWLLLSDEILENDDSPENFTTKLLKFNTDVTNAFAAGKISQTDYVSMHRKLSLPLMESIQKQAGQRTGFVTNRRYSDPLGGQYKKIASAVSSMTVNDDRKLRTRVQAFSFFVDAVSEAEDKGQTPSDKEYETMATQALRKAQSIYFGNVGEPEEKVLTINGVTLRYVGLNANGVADYRPDDIAQSAAKLKR